MILEGNLPSLIDEEDILMEKIEIKFKYTKEEYVKAFREYLLLTKTIKKRDMIVAILVIIFSTIWLILSKEILSAVCLLCGVLFLLLLCNLYYWMPGRNFSQNNKFKEEYNLTFSDEGILFKTDSINSNLKWNTYVDFMENEEFFYLIQAKQVFSLIPKRAFDSVEVENGFREMVLRNVNLK